MDRIAEFGEAIMWYVPKQRRTKLEPVWRSSFCLGRSWNTDSDFIGLADGSVTTARAMVRVPLSLSLSLSEMGRGQLVGNHRDAFVHVHRRV